MPGKKSARKKPSSRKSATKKAASKRPPEPESRPDRGFPIVGIGASAGGLEALEEFLRQLPADTGMGFVAVTHQHAGHVSLLPEILAKATPMPVVQAAGGMRVEPDHICIGPPGLELTIREGRLNCAKALGGQTLHLPIDQFLRSLAEDQGKNAICIILSGTGTDGTLGLKEVKAVSGMAMVEAPQAAKYAGMPSSAIATGLVDFVLPPEKMPEQLRAYVRGPYLTSSDVPPVPPEPLKEIFQILRSRTGHDFSSYKSSTVHRRIDRRMNVHQIEKPSEYVRFLRENPGESDLLFKELLIGVTSFFRDEEAFESLDAGPLTERLESLGDSETFRAWVPGCATGEEVYSLAILVRECMDRINRQFEVQIFGTDLDTTAIGTARTGQYPDGIAADVSADRLKRWFAHDDSFFRVRKDLREMAVFAPQNVIHDPPFTKLDLLSCRNLMIYLDAGLQKRLIPVFHYALKPGGILLLGPSESVGGFSDLFEVIDKKWKIYRRRETAAAVHLLPEIPSRITTRYRAKGEPHPAVPPAERHVTHAIDRLLLDRFCPASLVVNERGDIVHLSGRTGAYLEPVQGQPRMNVLEMAREGLRTDLGSALRQAASKNREIVRPNVRVRTNGDFVMVDLSVVKILEPETLRGLFLVAFRPAPPAPEPAPSPPGKTAEPPSRIPELERELRHTRESHQATIEELETSNEELKSANEELQSTNEELQSSNEELETAREEMQSLNEELSTVNTEMESKIEALAHANDDLENLLNSTDIATVFLDNELNIKRYTQRARGIFNLIPTDIGRPIGDLSSGLDYDRLENDCEEVIETLVSRESEVATRDGSWFLMRIMPYRTAENLIDGVVLTFVNIDPIKKNREERAYFEAIVETVREPLVVLDQEFRVVSGNRAFYETFQTRAQPTVGESIFEIGGDRWEIPELRGLLEKVLAANEKFENFRVEANFPRIGRRIFHLNARQIAPGPGAPVLILLAMEAAESAP